MFPIGFYKNGFKCLLKGVRYVIIGTELKYKSISWSSILIVSPIVLA